MHATTGVDFNMSINSEIRQQVKSHTIQASYTQGDTYVVSMPAGFRRHFVGKTLLNVCHRDTTEIRFVGKLVITET